MPIYKQRPRSPKKKSDLPLYRPIDRWIIFLWERRRPLFPFLILGIVLLGLWGGQKLYVSRSDRKAWALLEQRKFEEIVAKHSGSKAAFVSRLELARQALEGKRFDEAVGLYESLARQSAASPFFRIAALQNLALAYRENGEWAKALELLREAENDSRNQTVELTRLLKEDTEKKWQQFSPETSPESPPAP